LHLAVWNEKIQLIEYILSQSKGKDLVNGKDMVIFIVFEIFLLKIVFSYKESGNTITFGIFQ